jgi:hypothetical protein
MPASENHYFYLWSHRYVDDSTDKIVTRTCFGITSNPHARRKNYEGHVGHPIKFSHTWIGPSRPIRELERRVKHYFSKNRFGGYEWICEGVSYETVYEHVKNEVENIFSTIYPIVLEDL